MWVHFIMFFNKRLADIKANANMKYDTIKKNISGGETMSLKVNEPRERLIGTLPKVGIRPTIDGRRKGVRESLEQVTMDMAKSAANLISENLKYANGLPVECVIADTCIGGVAESAACAEKFEREGVGGSLTVTPCW